MLRKILFTLYILVVMCMGTATFIEKSCGSEITHTIIYGSPWFTALWILLATTSIAYIVRRRLRRLSILMLHGALLLILTGALTTHLSAIHGNVPVKTMLPEIPYICDVEKPSIHSPQTTNSMEAMSGHYLLL